MTGNALFDKIFMGVNITFILAAVSLVGYSHIGIKKEITDQIKEFEDLKVSSIAESQMTPIKIKKIAVNIISTPQRLRYLEVEMNILPFEESNKEMITKSEHVFKNTLISIADTMTHEELGSMTGKILLEARLRKQVNEAMGQPAVKQIYFSIFVIQ
jgi:flagellar FliL protein